MEKKKISFKMTPGSVNFIILFIFLSYIIFSSDESSIRNKIKYWQERVEIEKKTEEIKEQIHQDSIILSKIKNNDEYLERYAREKIYMSGKNEVIFKVK